MLHSGYLWKLSRSVMPGTEESSVAKWSRRFFVLRADSCLYFFKQENVSRPEASGWAGGVVDFIIF
jgi:hypothetical protein